MTVQSILAVKDGDTLGAVRGVLKTLLEKNVVDAMLVPLEVPRADQVAPILVKDPTPIDSANPLAPVMRVNTAAVNSGLAAGLVTEALTHYAPDVPAVGVCNVGITTKMQILEGLEASGLHADPARAAGRHRPRAGRQRRSVPRRDRRC